MSDFHWQDFLVLAKHLDGDTVVEPHPDARSRTVVSRAYYAAYHAVRTAAVAQGFVPPRLDAHIALVQYCHDQRRREWSNVAEKLRRLRDDRNAADYDLRTQQWAIVQNRSLDTATLICDLAEKLRMKE